MKEILVRMTAAAFTELMTELLLPDTPPAKYAKRTVAVLTTAMTVVPIAELLFGIRA